MSGDALQATRTSRMVLQVVAGLLVAATVSSCRQDMHDQPYFEAMEGTTFFADGRAERPQVVGTVARGQLDSYLNRHLYHGESDDGSFAADYPIEIDAAALERGKERFQIFCALCHDDLGYGDGLVIQRGMKRPPSYHEKRLQEQSPGYFFHVISNGIGAMYDHADRINVVDRWKIVAWIQTLQRSQVGTLADVPSDEMSELQRQKEEG